MKRILLKSVACLLFAAAIAACSNESDIDLTTDTTAVVPERENRASVWGGEIGQDRDGIYEITANKGAILKSLQDNANKEGATTSLETLEIVKMTALNDSTDEGYMLIAGDNKRMSIGVMLKRGPSGLFMVDDGFENPKSVSCWGCTSGCNLEYLYINGRKVPICNENGCGYDCVKKETEL